MLYPDAPNARRSILMKVDLGELKKQIETELRGMEQRRTQLLKNLEQIQGVLEIVEETMGESEDFRIQKALERMSEQLDGDRTEAV
jgi:ABC-type hemin transport system ATPase subunit